MNGRVQNPKDFLVRSTKTRKVSGLDKFVYIIKLMDIIFT